MALSLTITLLACSLSSPAAHAQTYIENTVYSFQGDTLDGANPAGDLIDINGILYGTTKNGGSDNRGTVFYIDEKSHAEFFFDAFITEHGYGGNPESNLLNVDGLLYGMTDGFGAHNDGTIFAFDPTNGAETVVHDFAGTSGQNDGAYPVADLINVNGILFGTTSSGGIYNGGTVFSFDPSTGTEKGLYSFGATTGDGYSPTDSLISVNGVLYGTTKYGGTYGYGSVFSIDPITEKKTAIYNFSNAADGGNPYGGLISVNGKLYGTTFQGGAHSVGNVFSIDPTTNTESVVYSFSNMNGDSANPRGNLILVNGKLFGTTYAGGIYGYGTVYSVDPTTGAETVAHSFTNTTGDGDEPNAGLLNVNGVLYGTTLYGGAYSFGTVFSLTPVSPPTASNDKYTLKYATAYAVHAPGVLANDNANGNGSMTVALVSSAAHGTLAVKSDGSFTYTPSAGFVGTDTFTYQAVNLVGHSNTATVSLIVQAVVPVAHNDAYVPTYFKAYNVKAPGVLANDYNGDNGAFTATLISTVSHGTLTFNSDGSFLYTPKAQFAGTDSFTYQAVDPIGKSNTATVTFTIHPINPIAYNDVYTPKYATAYAVHAPGVLANDDNGGTAPITATLVTNVAHGTMTFNSDGSFTYTPAVGFVGADTFTYKNSNSLGTSNTATVTLNVTAVVPYAHSDSGQVKHNTAFNVPAPGVLGNDYAGDSGALTASLVTTTSHGALTLHGNGSYSYVPNTGYSGTDMFTYKDTNAIGTSNTATVTLTVQ